MTERERQLIDECGPGSGKMVVGKYIYAHICIEIFDEGLMWWESTCPCLRPTVWAIVGVQ